jgi:serine/threonine-protein kinase
VWSVVAFALPLWALVRRARGRTLEPIWSATLLTGFAGIGSVVVLGGASFGSSEFCSTCVVTYALVLAYAAVCLGAGGSFRPARMQRGALLAVGATLVAVLALLYPGLQTPRSSAEARSAFLEAANRSVEVEATPVEAEATPVEVEATPVEAEATPVEAEATPVGAGEEPAEAEEKPIEVASRSIETEEKPVEVETRPNAARLEELISRLPPQLRQGLSDALALYARGDRVPLRPARGAIGSPTAPVRITEFTDVLCSHCANLHEALGVLREMLSNEAFAIEPRHFPLDSECNPVVQKSSGRGVSCLAARAMICLEEDSLSFADALFANQRRLTKEKIYQLAAPFTSRERLEACVTSAETDAKLRDDIEWAMEHEIRGTPLLLVNGREVPASLEFLYAMVLAKADPEHPAFAVLPPPQPQARLH